MKNANTESQSDNKTHTITKRIRRTKYIVGIHFSTKSKESVNDKILRLIKNDMTANTR